MSLISQDDAALIARVAGGDEDAAEAFDLRFRPFLLRFLQSRIPFEDQDDLLQEALGAAFQQLRFGVFREESGLGTWLIGILKHKIADYRARNNRDRASTVSMAVGSDTAGPLIAAQGCWNCDAAIDLERLLRSLPKLHRSVLLLNLREGWTTDEIASVMKKSAGTIGRILWEAKRMLQHKRFDVKKISESADQ